uniref:Ground-like domain-containing protein n=1 Tax=Elaeophora elaphi TaxID=1147741 RepID=A0A0R3S6U1_9BILA
MKAIDEWMEENLQITDKCFSSNRQMIYCNLTYCVVIVTYGTCCAITTAYDTTTAISSKKGQRSSLATPIPRQESYRKPNYTVPPSLHRSSAVQTKNFQAKHRPSNQTAHNNTPKNLLSAKKNEVSRNNPASSINMTIPQVTKMKHGKMTQLFTATASHSTLNDTKCNDVVMRKVIIQNINSVPSTAKRQIQSAIRAKFNGFIDVICSTKPFSYLINSDLYCEVQKHNVTCIDHGTSPMNRIDPNIYFQLTPILRVTNKRS